MTWRPPLQCGRRFLSFSAFFLCFLLVPVHGAGAEVAPAPAAPAPRLPPAEARALRRIAAKLAVTQWDLAAGPCNPAAGVDCQCSDSSNQTVCHVVRIVLKGRNFSGELPPDFADLPYL